MIPIFFIPITHAFLIPQTLVQAQICHKKKLYYMLFHIISRQNNEFALTLFPFSAMICNLLLSFLNVYTPNLAFAFPYFLVTAFRELPMRIPSFVTALLLRKRISLTYSAPLLVFEYVFELKNPYRYMYDLFPYKHNSSSLFF